MFCTGGIRCEKLSAHMLEQGFDQVYQLSGGILKYLEEIPEANSNWKGDCFVFDHRVSVSHGLAEGPHTMCHGCGRALDDKARSNKAYEKGSVASIALGRLQTKSEEHFENDRSK